MTTPGGSDDDRPTADAPRPRVDGRAPVLDGRPPSLRPATPPARSAAPPAPEPPAAPQDEAPSAPVERRSAIAAASSRTATGMPERARVPAGRARVPTARARIPGARARVPSDEPATGSRTATLAPPAPVEPPVPVVEPVPDPESIADRAIGRSLAQPPLPPHPGLGPTRKRLTVPPPSPPFVEADIPFHWRAELPSAIGRTVTIQVGDGRLDLGGTVVEIEQVREVRFKLQVEAALFRRAASARMMVAMTLADGSTVRVSARNAASARGAAHIVETLTYLWTLLSDTAGADERQVFVEKIDRGAEVNVGRLRLTGIGIAWKRNPIAPWSTLGDPRREGLDVVIPVEGGEPIVVPLTADDAYQLPTLVPLLRQRFA